MIYVIFIIALILYLIYIYYNKKKEGFALNLEKQTTYYLIGHFPLGYAKYIQLYESINTNPGLRDCGDINYSNNENDGNYSYANNLINLNIEHYFTYDICGVELLNNLTSMNNEDGKAVYIFSYGNRDIIDLNIKNMTEGKNITEEEKKKEYYITINRIFGDILSFNIPNIFNVDSKNMNKYFLFLNLITDKNDPSFENNILWNEQLLKAINNKNKAISNNNILRKNFRIIDVNGKKVNQKNIEVGDGIPKDLHMFICENERCKINNKHGCNNIPSLKQFFTPL